MNTPVILGFTPAVVLVVLAFAFGWLVLARLPIGIRLYALGSDPRMLRQAGVNDHAARFLILIVMGCFTAAGMAVMLGRLGAAAPTAGFGLELDAIVAVVIGGASFRGGEGRLRDTAIGVIFLAVINNGLSRPADGRCRLLPHQGQHDPRRSGAEVSDAPDSERRAASMTRSALPQSLPSVARAGVRARQGQRVEARTRPRRRVRFRTTPTREQPKS